MVFFVLSGFVLWGSFDRRYTPTVAGLASYSVARAYRLLPAAIACGAIYGVVAGLTMPPISATELLSTMVILSARTNGALWSLQVEVVGSLALFLVWSASRSLSLLAASAACCVLANLLRGDVYSEFMICFVAGAAINFVPAACGKSTRNLIVGLALVVGSSLVVGHDWPGRWAETGGAVLLVTYVRDAQPAFLKSAPVQFLGEVSYPLYLVHAAVFETVLYFIGHALPQFGPLKAFPLLYVGTVSISLPIAYVIHVVIERPVMMGQPRPRFGLVLGETFAAR